MKIIDKRIDYYDGVARTFRDAEPVYIRTPHEATFDQGFESEFSVLGFCGQAYPFYEAIVPVRGPVISYDRESSVEMLMANMRASERRRRRWNDWWLKKRRLAFVDDWKYLASTLWTNHFDRAPIWIIRKVQYPSSRIDYNPLLRNLGFFKIEPPAQAFQKLSMWLNNQACPMKPMPEISDELKAQSKGFDKNSFRGFNRKG